MTTNGTTPDITTRTGRNALHAYATDEAHAEWRAAADAEGITLAALFEALAPRIAAIVAADPTILSDARRVFVARDRRAR